MYEASRDWQIHRPREHTLSDFEIVEASACPLPDAAIDRIVAAYTVSLGTDLGNRDEHFWLKLYGDMKAGVHTDLVSGTASARAALSDPASNYIFYGFENLFREEAPQSDIERGFFAQLIYSALLSVCEAVGVVRMEQPEAYDFSKPPAPVAPVEDLLTKLDEAFGFRIDFPNAYRREVGLPTTRGVASYRAVHALYQAWRVLELTKGKPNAHVVEIGAGLGRTAYYAHRGGVGRYTIVDIPMTAAAQAYFLFRAVGPDSVRLYGETGERPVEIIAPEEFMASREHRDLVLNVDSLPEIGGDVAKNYFARIAQVTPTFLSINHEILPTTVRDLYTAHGRCTATRNRYWLRRGYLEEVISF